MSRFAIILTVLLLVACNRNSLELPPPKDDILVKEIICLLDSVQTVRMKFSQDKYDKEGKVDLELSNLTGLDLNLLKIYVEICDDEPSFYNCKNQYTTVITQLSPDKPLAIHLPFRTIQLAEAFINTGILSTDKRSTVLSAVYTDGIAALFEPSSSPPIIGLARGVVYADGRTIFRLGNIGNNNTFNITGVFLDTTTFNANFFARRSTGQVDSLTAELKLEVPNTAGTFNGTPATFNLLLHPPQTVAGVLIDKIQLKLRK
jgi:hypothetical protein